MTTPNQTYPGTPVVPLPERAMVFQVAYLRWLKGSGKPDSKDRLEAFRAGWAAHNKARAGRTRPQWAQRSRPAVANEV